MKKTIIKMSNNIGSLCLFLKNTKNINYLKFIEDNIPFEIIDKNLSEKIYYFINNIKEPILCNCGKHRSFIGFKNGYRLTCGDKPCSTKLRRETCLLKYGVDNPKKSKEILDREKENIKEKWNGHHYMCDEKIQEKFNKTMIENWGVEWPQQSEKISEKSKESFNNNPNNKEMIINRTNKILSKSSEEKQIILDKKIEAIIENWDSVENLYKHISKKVREKSFVNFGVDHHLSHPDIIKKRVDSYCKNITNKIKSKLPNNIIYIDRKSNGNNSDNIIKLKCLECDNEFNINRQYLVNRLKIENNICLICNPILSGKSNMELELLNSIEENYKYEILTNNKSIINGELDIYLPDLNLAFEFNGLYWHSEIYKDRKYHLEKTKKCNDIGIQLIHIWEDDWTYKQDIVKSIILNKLGKSERIFGRKCEIREITDNRLIREFLEKNHIQGFVGSKVKLGLYYNDELVSIMTFGNLRKSLGQISKEGSWELLRFCNKLNTSVIGGASRLLKYFTRNYKVDEIISYSDNSRSNGNMYEKLGFEFEKETDVNYYWSKNGIKHHRFNFRKDKLVKNGFDPNKTELQIMSENGYYRIFDCGSKKWIFKK